LSKRGARPGDRLVLTKPLGTGILATAIKADLAPPGTEELLIEVCSFLNDKAARLARPFGVRALTDVTGFGLALHTLEMADASEVGAELWIGELPVLAGVAECIGMGLVPGGTHANRDFALPRLVIDGGVTDEHVLLANDAQTSGGLLAAVPAERADEFTAALREAGVTVAAIIGRITSDAGRVHLRPGP
jgi:selenide,water dikinase